MNNYANQPTSVKLKNIYFPNIYFPQITMLGKNVLHVFDFTQLIRKQDKILFKYYLPLSRGTLV